MMEDSRRYEETRQALISEAARLSGCDRAEFAGMTVADLREHLQYERERSAILSLDGRAA